MRVLARDAATVDRLAALYRDRFHSFVRLAEAICGDPQLAWDAVQEAFANALRSRGDFRGEARVESWVWRCVVNASLQAKRNPVEVELSHEAFAVTSNGSEPSDERVREALARLTDRQRLIVFLRFYADLDYGGIAEALEISVGTVGAAIHSAKATLRRELEVSTQ